MRRALILGTLIAALALSAGCASLSFDADDSVGLKVAKVGSRVLLGVPTFGLSEAAIAHNTQQRDYKRKQRQSERYLQSLFEAREAALARVQQAETPLELEKARAELESAEREISRMTASQSAARQNTICVPLAGGGVFCRH